MLEILNVESGIETHSPPSLRSITGLFLHAFLVSLRKRRNYSCSKYISKYNLLTFFKNLEIVWGKFLKSLRLSLGKV